MRENAFHIVTIETDPLLPLLIEGTVHGLKSKTAKTL
jgi:hypothetical protein